MYTIKLKVKMKFLFVISKRKYYQTKYGTTKVYKNKSGIGRFLSIYNIALYATHFKSNDLHNCVIKW